MTSLIILEGQLLRCLEERTDQKDADGRWVWRDSEGDPLMWQDPKASDGAFVKRTVFEPVERVSDAHGVRFLCPKSFAKNGGPKGTHSVYIFFAGSPYAGRNTAGEEVRWNVIGGQSLMDLQLSPSILEQDDQSPIEWRCGWHGFVGSNGVAPGHAA